MTMITQYLNGQQMETVGDLPLVGAIAPDFNLTGANLSDIKLSDFNGKRLVLNIFPSLDTDVCAASVRRFNTEVGGMKNTAVLCVSNDLPFAAARFCSVNGIENVKTASAFRSDFGEQYGVKFVTGPLKGLLARAVVVIDTDGRVLFTNYEEDITKEPNYDEVKRVLEEN